MDTEHGEMSDQKRMMWRMKWREQMAIRVLTGVVIVIFVFWCGFEFGEIRASVGEMHGGYEMTARGGGNMMYTRTTGMGAMPVVTPATGVNSVSGSGPSTNGQ